MNPQTTVHPGETLLLDEIQRSGRRTLHSRGDFLYRQGEEPESFYYLEDGLVGLVTTGVSGRDHLVRLFRARQFLSYRALLGHEPYHATARVLDPSKVSRISAARFWELTALKPRILEFLAQTMARNLRRAELAIGAATDQSVTARVGESLVYLLEEYPEHPWTRQEIAEYVGSTTPTVFRVLAYLETRKLIRVERRKIVILDRKALLSLNEED